MRTPPVTSPARKSDRPLTRLQVGAYSLAVAPLVRRERSGGPCHIGGGLTRAVDTVAEREPCGESDEKTAHLLQCVRAKRSQGFSGGFARAESLRQ